MYTLDDFEVVFYSCYYESAIKVASIDNIPYDSVEMIKLSSVEGDFKPCYRLSKKFLMWDINDLKSGKLKRSYMLAPVFTIHLLNLDYGERKVEIHINYSGVENFHSVLSLPFEKDIRTSIDIAITKVNEIYDEELFEFYDSDAWIRSAIFYTLSNIYKNGNINKQYFPQLADAVETNNIGFELDPSFRTQLSKNMLFRPDKEVKIDVDTFINEKYLRYQG